MVEPIPKIFFSDSSKNFFYSDLDNWKGAESIGGEVVYHGTGMKIIRKTQNLLKFNSFERKLGTQTPLGLKTIEKKPSDSGFS